jgi:hypothetical protein
VVRIPIRIFSGLDLPLRRPLRTLRLKIMQKKWQPQKSAAALMVESTLRLIDLCINLVNPLCLRVFVAKTSFPELIQYSNSLILISEPFVHLLQVDFLSIHQDAGTVNFCSHPDYPDQSNTQQDH